LVPTWWIQQLYWHEEVNITFIWDIKHFKNEVLVNKNWPIFNTSSNVSILPHFLCLKKFFNQFNKRIWKNHAHLAFLTHWNSRGPILIHWKIFWISFTSTTFIFLWCGNWCGDIDSCLVSHVAIYLGWCET